MSVPVTFTLDLEDHRPDDRAPFRVPAILDDVLSLLDEGGVVGTFFVVGSLADDHPDLVRRIAAAGHEVGLHAWHHQPLTEIGPGAFRIQTARGRSLLEELTGRAVHGYRAPTFSLVESSVWVTEVLTDLGFTYSSSVLPARNPLFGWPGAPSGPFRWPSGLVELPAPVAGLRGFALPYLGGVYFRVLPAWIVRVLHGLVVPDAAWLYCHPYDFDTGEKFWVVPDAGRLGSRLLWLNRSRMRGKVERLLRDGAGPPLGQRVAQLGPLPTFGGRIAVAAS